MPSIWLDNKRQSKLRGLTHKTMAFKASKANLELVKRIRYSVGNSKVNFKINTIEMTWAHSFFKNWIMKYSMNFQHVSQKRNPFG